MKKVSRFAVTGKAREEPDEGGGDADDPRMAQAMAEMEREFSGLDENHPDPRQLGRLMRRMGDLMGSSWTPEMEEMARRLESGEDPDKLEERFGDALDESFGAAGEAGAGEIGRLQLLRKMRPEPRRDPRVYEMRDYLVEES